MASVREQDHKEMRDAQDAAALERISHRPTELHVNVAASSVTGKPKEVELHAFDGRVYLDTHGEARFTQDEWFALVQQTQAAYLAVS